MNEMTDRQTGARSHRSAPHAEKERQTKQFCLLSD